jgi:orotate phosphoribosyltransferase
MYRDSKQLWDGLIEEGVIRLEGQHVVLGTGEHTSAYANFAAATTPHWLRYSILEHLQELARVFTYTKLRDSKYALLGIGFGYWYTAMLAERFGDNVPAAEATKNEWGEYQLVRDQGGAICGRDVLIVDDVRNSGTTLAKLGELAVSAGARVRGALFILDRSATPITQTVIYGEQILVRSLFQHPMPTWPNRDACSLCQQKIPFSTQYGKGKEEHLLHGQPSKTA